jgi:DNA-directed RNA polymerase specialized sigma24 family protein
MKHEAPKSRETTKQTREVLCWSAAPELLAAAREGNSAAVEAAVEKLEGAIAVYVSDQLRGSPGKLAAEIRIGAPELAHWAVSQLRRKPPMGTPGRAAEATLKAWCKRTACNRLLSLWRELRDEPRRVKLKKEVKVTAKPTRTKRPELEHLEDPTADADAATLRSDRAEAIAAMLRACFPEALKLAQMRVDAPQSTDRELASAVGVSYSNLHKIRSRGRLHVVAFEQLQDDACGDDGAVARRIKPEGAISKEMLATIAKVRSYVNECVAQAGR